MESSIYLNEIDRGAAAWLRELYPGATVDERSIADVDGSDVLGFRRVHFFAGVGGWEYALDLAGWGDEPVWTGSCPCQPFSSAGKRRAEQDSRHLWPEFLRLIAECLPPVVLGEQVSSRLGRGWLAGVRADLEDLGYAVGAADLPACGVGAPHIRQRLFWGAVRLADAGCVGERGGQGGARFLEAAERPQSGEHAPAGGMAVRLADAGRKGLRGGGPGAAGATPGRVQGADGERQRVRADAGPGGSAVDSRLGHAPGGGRQQGRAEPGRPVGVAGAGGTCGPWSRYDLVSCRDGKARRTQPGVKPLVDGLPRGVVPGGDPGSPDFDVNATAEARVMRLRGYGNAIAPQLAALFIRAFRESIASQGL